MEQYLNTENIAESLSVATQYLNEGRVDQAKTHFQHILEQNPDSDVAMYFLSFIAYSSGEIEPGISLIKNAIKIKPTDSDYYVLLAVFYLLQNKRIEAMNLFEEALRLAPYNLVAIFNLLKLEYTLGKEGYFINIISKVISRNSDINDFNTWLENLPKGTHETHFVTGNLLAAQGRLDEAIEHYDISNSLLPGTGWVFTHKALALLKHRCKPLFSHRSFPPHYIKRPKKYIIRMSDLGLMGRFGDQLSRYITLLLYSMRHDLDIETPDWIGRYLFIGPATDYQISKPLPRIYAWDEKFKNGLQLKGEKCIDFDLYIKGNWGEGITLNISQTEKKHINDVLTPLPFLSSQLSPVINKLRISGKTVVALHIRRGDFENSNGTLWSAPNKLFLNWLKDFWPKLDNPVLYIASDEIEKVKDDFIAYNPLTADDFEFNVPGVEFIIDFYILSSSDIIAASSRSAFSTMANFLNKTDSQLFRADAESKIIKPVFDDFFR